MITPPRNASPTNRSEMDLLGKQTPKVRPRDSWEEDSLTPTGGAFYTAVYGERDVSSTERPFKARKFSLDDLSEKNFFRSIPKDFFRIESPQRLSTPELVRDSSDRSRRELARRMINNKKIYRAGDSEIIEASISSEIGKGCHATVAMIETDSTNPKSLFSKGFIKEDVSDAAVVVKIPKENSHVSIREGLRNSTQQYSNLEKAFLTLPDRQRPYAKVYNSPKKDGFILQEKVRPFEKCPWERGARLEDLSQDHRKIVDQIKQLYQDSYTKDRGDERPGLDLSWSNLGKREGSDTVVIFDYREDEDGFYIHAKHHLEELSNDSSTIGHYILEGLDEKIKAEGNDFFMERLRVLREQPDKFK